MNFQFLGIELFGQTFVGGNILIGKTDFMNIKPLLLQIIASICFEFKI